MGKLLYQGHASFRMETDDGLVIYLDPYAGEGYELPADVILSSHSHADHSSFHLITQKEGCVLITQKEGLQDGVYQTFSLGNTVVQAVPAYNSKHSRETTIGFLVSSGGVKFYFASDTSKIPEMEALAPLQIDYAFLPCDGFFNMGPEEAAECASILSAKYSVPIHTCRNTDGIFNLANAEKFNAPNRVIIKPGDIITY